MTALRVTVSRVRALFATRRMERDLDEELESHLAMLEEENMRRGMDPVEARRAARIALGGVAQVKESYRDRRGFPAIETVLRDICYAVRIMRRQPGFTATVMTVLALGIAASTTVFCMLNTLFLRPLPYPDADRLVLAGEVQAKEPALAPMRPVRYPNFTAWQSQNRIFDGMAAVRQVPLVVNAAGEPERARAERVSPEFFRVLGIQPALGRAFGPADFAPSAGRVLILSHRYWHAAFGAKPDVVGRTVRVDGHAATIVGVMPERFRAAMTEGSPNLWLPLVPSPAEASRETPTVNVIARVKPGIRLERARGDMDAIARRLEHDYPAENRDVRVRLESMPAHLAEAAKAPVAQFLVAVAAILMLLACANAANLLLARGIERRKEIALRLALGASRLRLARQFMIENLLLALLGGAAGVMLAFWSVAAFSKRAAPLLANTPVGRFEMDGRVLLFTLAVSLATGLLFGMLPAVRGGLVDVTAALKEGGAGSSGGTPKRRLSSALVATEVALSLVLLISAGFVLKSISQFWTFDYGFPIDHRLAAGVSLSQASYRTEERRTAFYRELLAQVEALPHVREAALASSLPIAAAWAETPVTTEDGGKAHVSTRTVSAAYLRALGIPLKRGRAFDGRDTAGSPGVAILNERTARRLWPGKDPVGRRIEMDRAWRTVVGVAADVVNQGTMRRSGNEVLLPYTQAAPAEMTLLVHYDGEPSGVAEPVRNAVHRLDPDLPVFAVRTLEAAHREMCAPMELMLLLVGCFAIAALVLAAAGVYGVAAHSVSVRTREIGIRMALGAGRRQVMAQIVLRGLRLAFIGIACGAAVALAVTKVIISQVWWVQASGVQLTAMIALLLGAVAGAACYLPARRATTIDPSAALRAE